MTAFDIKDLKKKGFSNNQIKEIKEAVDSNLDILKYVDSGFMPIQIVEIRLGLQENLQVELYANVEFDWFQMEEIRKGLHKGVDAKKYAKKSIPFEKMREIRKGLEEQLDLTIYLEYSAKMIRIIRKSILSNVNIMPFIEEGYDTLQLSYIRESLSKNINIVPYISTKIRGTAIREIMLGLEEGLDVTPYAKPIYSWQQMREIRLGIRNRVDISLYTSIYYNWKQMREIRFGLEMGYDVSTYCSYMYTAKEMKKKRELLFKEDDDVFFDVDNQEISFKNNSDLLVEISLNEMECRVKILHAGKKYTRDKILLELLKNGVTEGIDNKAIDRLINKKGNDEFVVVARGDKVVDGKDGWYEFFFDTENKRRPKILPDGSVDYRQTQWYQLANVGEKLAYYHSAKEGKNGKTVRGREIIAKKGKEIGVLSVDGCKLSDDMKTYVASKSGKVELEETKLIVKDIFEIEEVNTSIGNIDFDGKVYVKGNVYAGTTIKATGEIIIGGYVEGATIIAGGNIEIRSGVNATKKGYIESKKSINGRFFENASLKAGENINANYLLNSTVYAMGKIIIDGSRGSITGGTTYGRLGIEVYNIGNPTRLRTLICVGVDNEMIDKLKNIVRNIREVKKELEVLNHAFEEFNKKYAPEERNLKDVYIKIQKALGIYNKKLKIYIEEKEKLENDIELAKKSKIIAKGSVYDGTIAEIENSQLEISDLNNIIVHKNYNKIELDTGNGD